MNEWNNSKFLLMWNSLKSSLVEGLEQAEAGELREQEKFCRNTLEEMTRLEKRFDA